MATVKVNLSLEDAGKSVKARTDEVKGLNKELEKTKQLSTGTRTGAGAVRASYGPVMPGEGTAYGQARGSMGATGAAGRDFANQAQGLGGLVRLYATYAANVFAVSAAFTALSQAMNTTNMVQGLNQLGAASGVAMGNLAKQFADASGGAISLRESMESTAKAISAGLSQSQFIKLGEVAKQASQALGIGMSDAVSRLTRGIVKLEPELLDELGIFTKIGPATENYARTIGKAASQLTDFERRQAFANAVLTEGATKFGEIDIPTNPYDKLLASLKNTAQSILEVINRALVPLVDLLSSSPNALLAAIAAIGLKITTQALPAVTEYRVGLQQAAQDAQALAELRSKAAKEAYETAAAPAMQKQLEARADAYLVKEEKLASLVEKSERAGKAGKIQADFKQIMSAKDVSLIKDEDISKIDAHGKSLKRSTNLYTEWAKAAREAKIAAKQFDLELAKTPDVSKSDPTSAANIALRREASAIAAAKSRTIISQASIDTEVDGARAAIVKAMSSIKTQQLGTIRGAFTALSAAVAITTTKIIGLASAFGNLFAVVGIVITAYQLFTSFFGKNAKEAEKAKTSLDTLSGAIDSVSHTVDRLNKKPILESLTPQALAAKGTAFSNLTGSLIQALDDVEKEISARNTVDIFANWVSGIIGTNTEEKITKQLVDTIDGAVKSAATTTDADALRVKLANALSLGATASLSEIKKAAEKAGPAIRKDLAKVLDTISKSAERSSGSVKAFVDSLTESSKLYQDLSNSFLATDPLSRFAANSSKQLVEFSKVLDSTELVDKLALLSTTSQDIRFLQLLPLDQAKQVLAISKNLQQVNQEIAQGLGDIRALEEGRLQAQQKLDNTTVSSPIVPKLKEAIKEYDKLIAQARELTKSREAELGPKLEQAERVFNTALRQGLLANIERFQTGIEMGAKKARLELEKTSLRGIIDPARRGDEEADIQQRAIRLDADQLRSQLTLIRSNDKLRLAIEEQTYTDRLTQKMAEFGVKTELEARVRDPELDKQFRTLEVAKNIQDKTVGQLQSMLQTPAVTGDVFGAIQSRLPSAQMEASARQKLKELETQSQNVELNRVYTRIDNEAANAKLQYDIMLKELELNRQSMTAGEFAAQKSAIEQGKALIDPAAALRRAELRPRDSANTAEGNRRLKVEQDIADTITNRAVTSAEELESLTQAQLIYKQYFTDQTKGLDIAGKDLELKQASLAKDLERGKISQDEFNSKNYLLDLEQAGLTRANALLAEQEKYTNTILDIRTKIAEQGGVASPEQITAQNQALATTNSATEAINRQYDQTLKLRDLNKDLAQRQQGYADAFGRAFDGMTDAIVNFAKTGKLSFSDMISSFIEDLIRLEIKQMQMQFIQGSGGPIGLATRVFGSLLGGGGIGADNITSGMSQSQMLATQTFGMAKGGAWDSGVQAFAKGGAFTNSVVSSPTLFKFAKGTGLMGEAGPEAIMPLKRDSSGNLGVRAQGSGAKVDVVVNNFGSEKAETRETVDSRGNRKIEVLIGEMTASETARSGSPQQRALGGTFGLRPQLIRR
jgi:lambda family phage tail tape measure protein